MWLVFFWKEWLSHCMRKGQPIIHQWHGFMLAEQARMKLYLLTPWLPALPSLLYTLDVYLAPKLYLLSSTTTTKTPTNALFAQPWRTTFAVFQEKKKKLFSKTFNTNVYATGDIRINQNNETLFVFCCSTECFSNTLIRLPIAKYTSLAYYVIPKNHSKLYLLQH